MKFYFAGLQATIAMLGEHFDKVRDDCSLRIMTNECENWFTESVCYSYQKSYFWWLFVPLKILCLISYFLEPSPRRTVLSHTPMCYDVDVASHAFISIWMASGIYHFNFERFHFSALFIIRSKVLFLLLLLILFPITPITYNLPISKYKEYLNDNLWDTIEILSLKIYFKYL